MHEPLQPATSAWHRALGWPEVVSVDALYAGAWRDIPMGDSDSSIPPSTYSDKRRMEFIAGRHCARKALLAAGCTQPLDLGRDPDGLPTWPSGFVGSISHTALTVVAAVAPASECRGLGIDIEPVSSNDRVESCRGQIGTDDEWKLMAKAFRSSPYVALFSAKEALFKALFPLTRQMVGFGAARAATVSHTSIGLELTMDWSSPFRAGMILRVQSGLVDGHVASGLIIR